MDIKGIPTAPADTTLYRDPLTGALTRDCFRMLLEQALATPQRHTALLLIAIPDLHRVTERHGVAARDTVLKELGRTLLRFEAETVSIARIDEAAFAAILRDHPPAQVSTVAAEMRLKFAAQQIRDPETTAVIEDLTVNVGIASRLPCEPRERLMRRADAALGKAIAAKRRVAA